MFVVTYDYEFEENGQIIEAIGFKVFRRRSDAESLFHRLSDEPTASVKGRPVDVTVARLFEAEAGTERDAIELVKSGSAIALEDSKNLFLNNPDGEARFHAFIKEMLADKPKD